MRLWKGAYALFCTFHKQFELVHVYARFISVAKGGFIFEKLELSHDISMMKLLEFYQWE